ncbi:hypothetical protein ZYGR_0AG01830 [Zygosaccharomyces rouxii]|uniref:Conserved oligomeric Golgi complex subunit 2 n=1 Tax=Zygosaccharomyces rouxii TaxID=4956 RepID=A0A1Q3A902_ZYGRO|nr:hypothetical protein ZYGR_0AG01830 [Zygosaccharomyces rouxii]
MDFLEEDELDLDLPTITEINRDLFIDQTHQEKEFDVDEFLINNNFQYVPLDSLIHDLSGLSKELEHALPEKIAGKYNDYLKFCKPYTDEDSQSILEIRRTKTDLNKFITQLNQLTHKGLSRTQGAIDETVAYLRKLDSMIQQLQNHSELPPLIQLAKEMSTCLHAMCGTDPIDPVLITELTAQLHKLMQRIRQLFDTLSGLNSPFLKHQRNGYQGLLQEFQISLKLLTARCLEDPNGNQKLSRILISILNSSR